MSYKRIVYLVIIFLSVISFLLLNFVFGRGEDLLSAGSIITYILIIMAIIGIIFSKKQ
jgi:hypothetical protein